MFTTNPPNMESKKQPSLKKPSFNYYNFFIATAGIGGAAAVLMSVFIALTNPSSTASLITQSGQQVFFDANKTASVSEPIVGAKLQTPANLNSPYAVTTLMGKTNPNLNLSVPAGSVTAFSGQLAQNFTNVYQNTAMGAYLRFTNLNMSLPGAYDLATNSNGKKVLRIDVQKATVSQSGRNEILGVVPTAAYYKLAGSASVTFELNKNNTNPQKPVFGFGFEPTDLQAIKTGLRPTYFFSAEENTHEIAYYYVDKQGVSQRIVVASNPSVEFTGVKTFEIKPSATVKDSVDVLWNGTTMGSVSNAFLPPAGTSFQPSLYVAATFPTPTETLTLDITSFSFDYIASLKNAPTLKIEAAPISIAGVAYDGGTTLSGLAYGYYREMTAMAGGVSVFGVPPPPPPPTRCGNGICEAGEDPLTCPIDCVSGPVCGNGICEAREGADSLADIGLFTTDSVGEGRSFLNGSRLLVSNPLAGTVQLYNVANPNVPFEITSVSTSGSPLDIASVGDYAYVVTEDHLETYALPSLTKTTTDIPRLAFPAVAGSGYLFTGALDTVGGRMSAVAVTDLSDPANPNFTFGYLTFSSTYGRPNRLAIDNDLLVVGTDNGSLLFYDTSFLPSSPRLVGTLVGDSNFIHGLVLSDNKLAVLMSGFAPETKALVIYDVSDTTLLPILGRIDLPGIGGDIAYNSLVPDFMQILTKRTDGIFIETIAVSDPAMLSKVNEISVSRTGTSIPSLLIGKSTEAQGVYVYARMDDKIHIYRVGACPGDCFTYVCGDNRCDPGETCPADCGGTAVCGNGVCEAGENALNCPSDCVSGPVCGNNICENNEAINLISSTSVGYSSPPSVIDSLGDYAYVATGDTAGLDYLKVYRVSDPAAVGLLTTLSLSGLSQAPADVKVSESNPSLLYVLGDNPTASGSVVLRSYDISDPVHPAILDTLPITSSGPTVTNRAQLTIAGAGRWVIVVAPASQEIYVVDASDASNLILVPGHANPINNASYVKLDTQNEFDNYVYVAYRTAGGENLLETYRISGTGTLELTSSLSLAEVVRDVYAVNGKAYILRGDNLVAYNLSDPANPSYMGETPVDVNAREVVARGNFAFVGTLNNVAKYNISNPAAMSLVGRTNLVEDNFSDMSVTNNSYVYATGIVPGALQENHLLVFGQSGSCAADCPAGAICGNGLCEAGEDFTNCAIDCPRTEICNYNNICEPGRGETAANCTDCLCGNSICDSGEGPFSAVASAITAGESRKVFVDGDYVYVANEVKAGVGGSFEIWNVANPASPTLASRIGYSSSQGATDVVVSHGVAYVATRIGTPGSLSTIVYDVSNPESPAYVREISGIGAPLAVDSAGTDYLLYGGTGSSSFSVYDFAGFGPVLRGTVPTATAPKDIYVTRGYAYVAEGRLGFVTDSVLEIFDVSDPAALPSAPVGQAAPGIIAGGLAVSVSGNYAYVIVDNDQRYIAGTPALQVFDITDKTSPTRVSDTAIVTDKVGYGALAGVDILNNWVIISLNYTSTDGSKSVFSAFDVSDPASPFNLSTVSRSTSSVSGSDIAVYGRHPYAYQIVGGSSITVLDMVGSCPADCGFKTAAFKAAASSLKPGPGTAGTKSGTLPAILEMDVDQNGLPVANDLGAALLTLNTQAGERKITFYSLINSEDAANASKSALVYQTAKTWLDDQMSKGIILGGSIDYVLENPVFSNINGVWTQQNPGNAISYEEVPSVTVDNGDGTTSVTFEVPISETGEISLDFNFKDTFGANVWGGGYKVTFADKDQDDDGVIDDNDSCPDTAPGAAVNNYGCSQAQVDQDADGVCDPGKENVGAPYCSGSDACPAEHGSANFKGCPVGLRVSIEEVDASTKPATKKDEALETRVYSNAVGSCGYNINFKPSTYDEIWNNCPAEHTGIETNSPGNPPRNLVSDLVTIGAGTGNKYVLVRSPQSADGTYAYMGFDVRNLVSGESRDLGFTVAPKTSTTFNQNQSFTKNNKGIWLGTTSRVINGSYLEIIAPDYTIWSGSEFVYPFVFFSDSDWTVDVCMEVPSGYQIVDPGQCAQVLIAGQPFTANFVAKDIGSPKPDVKIKMKLKHKGKTQNLNFDIPGRRKGKDK